jgi:hypothetical protein
MNPKNDEEEDFDHLDNYSNPNERNLRNNNELANQNNGYQNPNRRHQ